MATTYEACISQILSYVLLRNSFTPLQCYKSSFLVQVGASSLWLFVSHFHILLAFDGKGLLVLLPKLYLCNAVVVIMVFALVFVGMKTSLHTLMEVKSLQYFTFVQNIDHDVDV